MIITIDGPAGTGKSTVAKNLAEDLGYTYFETGAMYRAITYAIIKYKVDYNDKTALKAFLDSHPVTIRTRFNDKYYIVGDEDVTGYIRSKEVTDLVSAISAIGDVRETLVTSQRELAKGVNAVFEGRDMGTVVFPDADVKIFLTASSEVRAKRRYNELIAKNPSLTITLDEVLQDINRRDAYDASRDISPMRPADDAIIIDTSTLSADEVENSIINITKEVEDRPLTNQ
ncbi:MAG: (d)CMP kinase [Verrucomicrobia bacterium]|nr:(d)CMP kinase [Verrucomicrobiota bacterium]